MFERSVERVILAIVICILISAISPTANAEIEIRKELRSGDLLYNDEFIFTPFAATLVHSQSMAVSDSDAFALSFPSPGAESLTMAQTSDESLTASRTGFMTTVLPIVDITTYPGDPIGTGKFAIRPEASMRLAGLPYGTGIVFPAMTKISRNSSWIADARDNIRGINNSSGSYPPAYDIDVNSSIPYYPGNIMIPGNNTTATGKNETVLKPLPKSYMKLMFTPGEVANKTVMERMWRNVHLNFALDQAYVGETCNPEWIWPKKEIYKLMLWVPQDKVISGALNITRPGTQLEHIFWPL